MKRGLVIGGGVLGAMVVVIVGIAVFLISGLDALVKEAVERVGSDATRAEVTLDKVEISLKSGRGALGGLVVGNPKGFSTPNAFELGGVSLTLDTATVGQDPVVIKEIVVTEPRVTYELGEDGSNIDAIKKNVAAYAKRFSSGAEAKQGGGPKLVIENVYVRGGTVGVSAPFLKGKALATPLPDIHLKDVGKRTNGADPAQVAKAIIDSMTRGVGQAVGGLDLDEMMKAATKGAKGAGAAAGEAAGEAMEGVKGAGAAAGEAAGKAVEGAGRALEDAGSGLKKLFGN